MDIINENLYRKTSDSPYQTGATVLPNFTGKHKAANTRAWLARQEWSDYQARFAPREQELLQRVSKEGAIDELNSRLGSIHVDTKRAFDANQSSVDMMNQRYGVTPSPDVQQSQNRQSSISQSLSEVDAINRTRDSISSRNMNVVGGGGMTGRQLING